MKIIFVIIIFVFTILLSCHSNEKRDRLLIGYGERVNGQYKCAYVFDNENHLVKNICQDNEILSGYLIHYYENGLLSSVEQYQNDTLHGNKILFHSNGLIRQILPYINGKISGESFIYFMNGALKAVNLFHGDSIFYVRIFTDSINIGRFEDRFLPIVTLESDSVEIGDSIYLLVKFPLFADFGIDSGKFDLHFDRFPAKMLEGKNPFGSKIIPLTGDEILIGYSSFTPSHDRFYCYITDSSDSIVSPTIYRDLYFIAKE